MDEFRHVDKHAWKKYLFYIDVVVWGIFAIAVSYLVTNIYLVGFFEGTSDLTMYHNSWWRAFLGLAFAMGSLAWVFFRFWKNGFLAVRRPF